MPGERLIDDRYFCRAFTIGLGEFAAGLSDVPSVSKKPAPTAFVSESESSLRAGESLRPSRWSQIRCAIAG